MDVLHYKGYTGTVDYAEPDDCLSGKVLGLSKNSITYEGISIKDLKKDFQDGIDDYLEDCKEREIVPEKPFKGSLNIRISPEIHSRIAAISKKSGISINAFINRALEDELKMSY